MSCVQSPVRWRVSIEPPWRLPLRWLVPLGGIDGRRGLSITNSSITAFLDHAIQPIGLELAHR